MEKISFNRALNALLAFKDIPVDRDKNEKFFELMKNDFSDEEFNAICGDICKTENLYNKYPDPYLFYQRKPKINNSDILEIDKQKFISKVNDYLSEGFISSYDRQEFNDSLTDTERRVLQRYGGISELWASCHRDEYSRSIDSILRELKNDFESLYKIENKNVLQLTNGAPKSIENIKQKLLEKWSI